ncbi:hypothetical protein ACI2OX_04670 [Bacillus sp. N9]
MAIDENCWTGVSSSLDGTQHLLFIHSTSNEGETITSEDMFRLIKITFATLATIQFEGNEIRHIALPVLFRKGIRKRIIRSLFITICMKPPNTFEKIIGFNL